MKGVEKVLFLLKKACKKATLWLYISPTSHLNSFIFPKKVYLLVYPHKGGTNVKLPALNYIS